MQTNFDIIVIGGGPAGCAAAAFAARCKWRTAIIDRSIEGGYLGGLGNVSYFPGFPEPIGGRELLKRMRRQAELEGASLIADTARGAALLAPPFKILTDGGKEFEAGAVIVATGAAARTNYLHGERELMGRGVSHDALADGPGVAKRAAAVVGKSKQAAEEALILARFAEKIHFIIPSNKLDADDAIMARLQRARQIELHLSASLKKINGTDHVSSITAFIGGQEKEIPVAGVFTYVHEYQQTTGFLEKALDMAADGSIKVDERLATSVDGVFACGDVLCGKPQLPAVSAAQGLLAGIGVDRHLSTKADKG
ncbi:MAG: FAD-dependent oxidoreductase [Pseudomonadota bacterium]